MVTEIILVVIFFMLALVLAYFLGMQYGIGTAEREHYKRMRSDAYEMSGWQKPGDPAPYVPPFRMPDGWCSKIFTTHQHKHELPHIAEIEDALRDGKRAVVMVKK